MSLDAQEIAERARERLTEKGEAEADLTIPRLIALVADAKLKLAHLVAEDRGMRGLLTNTYEVTATAGEAALASALGDAEPLLLEHLARASVFIENYDFALKPLPDRGAQSLEAESRASYVVEDNTLIVKGPDGPFDGTVTIRRASCNPSFDRIETVSLEDRLIDLVAALAAPPPPAQSRSTTQAKGNSSA